MRSISGLSPSRWAAGLLAAAAVLAPAGCGAESGSEGEAGQPEASDPVGQELAGSVAQLAQCRDWVDASEPEKLATVEDIRSHVNLEGTGVEASALSDSEALEVFDNGCDEAYAQGFRLHVMYARAAAFQPLKDVAEGKG